MLDYTPDPERLTLTIVEAARRLGIGRNSAYEAARLGQLPTIRSGRRLLVPRAALESLLTAAPEPRAPLHPPPAPADARRGAAGRR